MKVHWWSCVWSLLCMPAGVTLSTWTVSQDPLSISLVRVNSSTEISCSTSLPDPMGVSLNRGFHGNNNVMYLELTNGKVNTRTTAAEFAGRIQLAPDQQIREGYGFTWQLSLLRLEDTDWYYCTWVRFTSETQVPETLSSCGTTIIVRERDLQEHCKRHIGDLIFIALSVTAFTVILLLVIGALIVKCRSFKKYFRPTRAVKPSTPNRHQHVCPQQRVQHCPHYSLASANTLDFRGIL